MRGDDLLARTFGQRARFFTANGTHAQTDESQRGPQRLNGLNAGAEAPVRALIHVAAAHHDQIRFGVAALQIDTLESHRSP